MDQLSQVIDDVTQESATQDLDISRVIQTGLNNMLDELIEDCGDIVGAMISGADGIAWADRLRPELDRHRFAAMSSALLALADNLMRETNEGTPRNVMIESDAGNIFVMHAGTNLLLTVFTRAEANLGMPLAHARKTAEEIGALVIET